jgi:hypothetical protein
MCVAWAQAALHKQSHRKTGATMSHLRGLSTLNSVIARD